MDPIIYLILGGIALLIVTIFLYKMTRSEESRKKPIYRIRIVGSRGSNSKWNAEIGTDTEIDRLLDEIAYLSNIHVTIRRDDKIYKLVPTKKEAF